MPESIEFLSVEDVLIVHENTIIQEGGLNGLRDAGLLESAVAMPRQQFGGAYLHEDLAAMASAYLFHLAANHPFLDGNKRAAVLSALVFLESNGVETLPAQQELEAITLLVASSQMSKEALTDWMRQQIEPGR